MSETMSSSDIEDVLSSIRRLVSDDYRPAPKAEAKPKPAAPAAEGKLMLTPALRVVSSRPDSPAAAVAAHTDAVDPSIAEDALPEDEAPFINVEDDDFGHVVSFSADKLRKAEVHPPVARFADRAAFDDAHVDETEDYAAEVEDKSYVNDVGMPDAKPPDLTRVVNDIAASFSGTEAEWESETGDSAMAEALWQVPAWGDPTGEDNAAQKRIADLAEAAVVAEIVARGLQETAAQPSMAQSDADKITDCDADGYFDETMLRDIVRDIIREELSGTLGERITRNVRKLVRAEIGRALSVRDLG